MSYPGSENKNQPIVTVVSVTNSPTGETSHTFQKATKSFFVICNEWEMLRVAWATGQVGSAGGNWFKLFPRECYKEPNLLIDITEPLYMNAPDASANVDVAIVEWT
jgi:hypothetical protein